MVALKFQVLMKGLSLPVDFMSSSATDDLCSFGSFNDQEGESLLAGNSLVGIGEQGGRPRREARTKRQRLQHLAHHRLEKWKRPQICKFWRARFSVVRSFPHSPTTHLLECLISERVGVPVHSFFVCCDGNVWRDGMELQRGVVLQMVGRLLLSAGSGLCVGLMDVHSVWYGRVLAK